MVARNITIIVGVNLNNEFYKQTKEDTAEGRDTKLRAVAVHRGTPSIKPESELNLTLS